MRSWRFRRHSGTVLGHTIPMLAVSLGYPERMKAPTAAPYPAGVATAVRYARDVAAGKTGGGARTVVSPHYPVQFVSTVPTGTGSLKRSDR
jgi:hypothetical protein